MLGHEDCFGYDAVLINEFFGDYFDRKCEPWAQHSPLNYTGHLSICCMLTTRKHKLAVTITGNWHPWFMID